MRLERLSKRDDMERRKILITAGMSSDALIFITDAPCKEIRNWCNRYKQEMENGENTYLESLEDNYYIKVLHDSETDDKEDINVIGYDEHYDLFNSKIDSPELNNRRTKNRLFLLFKNWKVRILQCTKLKKKEFLPDNEKIIRELEKEIIIKTDILESINPMPFDYTAKRDELDAQRDLIQEIKERTGIK